MFNCYIQNPHEHPQSIKGNLMCFLCHFNRVPLITTVCFHILALVSNTAPGLMETVAVRLSFRVNTVMASFRECSRWFVVLFPFPKLNENRPGWLIGTTVVGSCFIYESWWFSPVCLLGPVIHEWTRQPEPAIVEVHWEQWVLRINFLSCQTVIPNPHQIHLSFALYLQWLTFLS